MSTASQIAANQYNAQLSSGPTSEAGKATSSLNALKTGLTGRTVLLPSEDTVHYQTQLARFEADWQPATDAERTLVQSLADTDWRLLRIPSLEAGIYALGRLEFAGLFAEEDAAVRSGLLDAKIFLAYQRQLNNLSIQEGRLRRQREKDSAALRELQAMRRQKERARVDEAAAQYIEAVHENRHHDFDPAALGFEFSSSQIEMRAMDLDPNLFADYEAELATATPALKKAA